MLAVVPAAVVAVGVALPAAVAVVATRVNEAHKETLLVVARVLACKMGTRRWQSKEEEEEDEELLRRQPLVAKYHHLRPQLR